MAAARSENHTKPTSAYMALTNARHVLHFPSKCVGSNKFPFDTKYFCDQNRIAIILSHSDTFTLGRLKYELILLLRPNLFGLREIVL